MVLKHFFYGLLLSVLALVGAALILLPAVGVVSGAMAVASAMMGIALTVTSVMLEHTYATDSDITPKPPHITGIIILTTALTYAVLTLIL